MPDEARPQPDAHDPAPGEPAQTVPRAVDASIPTTPPRPHIAKAGERPVVVTIFVVMAACFLAADLAMKNIAFRTVAGVPVVIDPATDRPDIPDHEPIVVLPSVLHLQLTTNPGAVFGMGKGNRWFFVVISIGAAALILRFFWRSPAKAVGFHLALALILAGAMGNLYDRIVYGVVRDMLLMLPDTHLPFGLAWPRGGDTRIWPWIFNLADAELMVGVGMILLISLSHELRALRQKSAHD